MTTTDIPALISESEELERLMGSWQTQAHATASEIEDVRRRYRRFFVAGKLALDDEQRVEFQKAHDGSFGDTDITDFLADPLGRSPIFDTPELAGTEMAWKVGFATHVAPKLAKQRELLEEVRLSSTDPEQLLSTWATVFRRLPTFLRTLSGSPRKSQIPPIELTDEKGLQDVIEAILRLHFDDVRREDYVPQAAGAASVVDFQLPEIGLFVEAKMTRSTLKDKQIGEELLTDAGRYPAHPDCKAVLAIVYDPARLIKNPAGLEADLSVATASGVPMRTIVVS